MALTEPMPIMQAVEAQTWAVRFLEAHPGMRMERLSVVRGRGV